MLILTRKPGEEIRINKDITVKIFSAGDNQVKIGIDAPPDVQILRGELFDKIVSTTVDASEKSKVKLQDISSLKLNKIEKLQGSKPDGSK